MRCPVLTRLFHNQAVLGKHEELASKLVAIEMGTQDSEFVVNLRSSNALTP